MPDYRGLRTQGDHITITDDDMARMRSQIAVAMGATPEDGAPIPKQADMKETYQANKHIAHALDNTMSRSLHKSASSAFVAVKKPMPLKRGYTRYKVAISDLPADIVEQSPDRAYRCAVANDSDDNDRYLECVWDKDSKSLFIDQDRGSIGWPMSMALFTIYNVRGDVVPDGLHLTHNASLGAWHDAGMNVARLEYGLVLTACRRLLTTTRRFKNKRFSIQNANCKTPFCKPPFFFS